MEVLMNNEDEIRKMLSAGMSNKDIYTSYNVSKSTFTKFKNFLMQSRGI
jgi:DNA invertase Pin-like site-specific DNA recombinase